MTVNSFQADVPTTAVGLSPQTFNVQSAANYKLSIKSFLPYVPGGQAVTSGESFEKSTLVMNADTAGSLNSSYWTFQSAEDAHKYYAWYNVDSGGTDPAVTGRTGIEVDIASGDTANTVASATRTALSASGAASYITISGSTSGVILSNKQYGATTDVANGTGSPLATITISQDGSQGVPESSALVISVTKNSTQILALGPPDPFQEVMAGQVYINAAASDVITVSFSSVSSADVPPNAVKTIINLSSGA